MSRSSIFVFALFILISVEVQADEQPKERVEFPEGLQMQIIGGLGGPLLGFIPAGKLEYQSPESAVITSRVGIRLHNLSWLSKGLEVSLTAPGGIGVNAISYWVKTDRFRLHLGDVGFLINLSENAPVTARWMPRKVDLTLGFGAEYALNARWSISLDYRAFLLNPALFTTLGDFYIPPAVEGLLHGQWNVLLSYTIPLKKS